MWVEETLPLSSNTQSCNELPENQYIKLQLNQLYC